MQTARKRIVWVDVLKGLAMTLVVIGHAAGTFLSADGLPKYQGLLNVIYNSIYAFHMPLCFVLSGVVFSIAYSDGSGGLKNRKVVLRALDLVVVYLLFSVLMFAFKTWFSGSVNRQIALKDLLLVPVRPINGSGLWYLYVLAELYGLALLLHRLERALPIPVIAELIGLLVLSCLSGMITGAPILEIKRVLLYGFFFCMGYRSYRNGLILPIKYGLPMLVVGVAACLVCAINGIAANELPVVDVLLGTLVSAGLISLASNVQPAFTGMWHSIGRHMMEIYVMHLFIVPAVRIILLRFVSSGNPGILLITIVVGIVIPILVGELLRKLRLYDYLFCFCSRSLKKER